MTAVSTDQALEEAGALAGRLFEETLGMFEMATVWLGIRLGLYAALDTPGSAAQVAARTGILPRYAREWLEQQAISGLVTVDDPGKPADERVYSLSPAQRLALLDDSSPAYAGGLALLGGGGCTLLPRVLESWQRGSGISFGEYGDDVRTGQALLNKADYHHRLTQEWLPSVPVIDALLRRDGARAADLGCGVGWSSIALARGYPGLMILGIDSDEASIMDARRNAAEARLSDRVEFEVAASDAPRQPAAYDVVFFFEALHDMAHPIEALQAARAMLRPGGRVFVMDEGAAETFAPNGPPTERLLATSSVLHCLPVGLSEPGSAATGALLRPAIMQGYAEQAGYTAIDMLPIEHDFMRFYLLTP